MIVGTTMQFNHLGVGKPADYATDRVPVPQELIDRFKSGVVISKGDTVKADLASIMSYLHLPRDVEQEALKAFPSKGKGLTVGEAAAILFEKSMKYNERLGLRVMEALPVGAATVGAATMVAVTVGAKVQSAPKSQVPQGKKKREVRVVSTFGIHASS